jgi:hypothetical protein
MKDAVKARAAKRRGAGMRGIANLMGLSFPQFAFRNKPRLRLQSDDKRAIDGLVTGDTLA